MQIKGRPYCFSEIHRQIKVKICGITNLADALQAARCGADALGFVFYTGSSRNIQPEEAKDIIARLPARLITVGVFVNEDIAVVKRIVKECGLDCVQLHGNEDNAYLRKLNGLCRIKAIRLKNKSSFQGLERLPVEALLFDTYSSQKFGGTGASFDWKFAPLIKHIQKPYIISGGLAPQNVSEAIKLFKPYAVDVSSGVEARPGKKDKKLLREFIENAKHTHKKYRQK